MSLTQSQKLAVATYLSEVLLPDSVEETVQFQTGQSEFVSLGAAFAGIVGGLPAIAGLTVSGIGIVPAILTTAGVATIGSFITQQNANQIRVQLSNAFWLSVKQQIACTLPDDGIITDAVRERIAWAIEKNSYPFNVGVYRQSTLAQQAVAIIIRSYTTIGMQALVDFAATRWEGNQNGADFCLPPYVMFPNHVNANAERLTDDTWKLSINTPVGSDYAGAWRTPFVDSCMRVRSLTVIRHPVSFFNPPDAAIGTVKLCGAGQEIILENLTSLVGLCISNLTITSREPVEFIVKFDDCGSTVIEQSTYVQFEQLSQTISENSAGLLRVRLYTDTPLQSAVTVDVNASPAQGTGFTYTPTQITFPIGSESGDYQDVTINVLSDIIDEPNENVVFTLASATGGAQIGLPNTHVLTIGEPVSEFFYNFRLGTQGWTIEELTG